MPEWIRKPGRCTTPRFIRDFTGADGTAFTFDTNEQGEPVFRDEEDRANYALALRLTNEGRMTDSGVRDFSNTYWDPGAVRCKACGNEVNLSARWEKSCACGTEYSASGQRLRSNWRAIAREMGEM